MRRCKKCTRCGKFWMATRPTLRCPKCRAILLRIFHGTAAPEDFWNWNSRNTKHEA